jgi:hypothetical protein
MRFLQGSVSRWRTPIEDAYDQFGLERQGNRLSPRTLGAYDHHLDGFSSWLHPEHPQVRQFKDLTVDVLPVHPRGDGDAPESGHQRHKLSPDRGRQQRHSVDAQPQDFHRGLSEIGGDCPPQWNRRS